jgi:hypothetical protein
MSHWVYIETEDCPTCGHSECLYTASVGGNYGFGWSEGTPAKEALVKADEIVAGLNPEMRVHYYASGWPTFWEEVRRLLPQKPNIVVVIH